MKKKLGHTWSTCREGKFDFEQRGTASQSTGPQVNIYLVTLIMPLILLIFCLESFIQKKKKK
ncbi:hypothetical protein Fmac_021790 [Flemingia macrophylla]|uniref:Uncharacterized protein n=1 Tax=Flemingia macrophylla TaxID=520843 RepID=A0ABD1LXV2_9FABA